MKATVYFFKESGKWYEKEEFNIPESLAPWDFRRWLSDQLRGRYSSMSAVVIDPPWGFPLMLPVAEVSRSADRSA